MKKLLIVSAAVILTTSLGSYLVLNKASASGVSPVSQQNQLDSHDAQPSSAESSIAAQPSIELPISVDTVGTPATPAALAPAPTASSQLVDPPTEAVVVTSSTQRMVDTNNWNCDLIYSDDSTDSIYMGYYLDLTGKTTPPDTCSQFIGQAK